MGGFPHYPWKSGDNENVCDKGKKSFIFSLTMMEKYNPVSEDNLLCLRKDWGPMFGYKGDLWIADQCNSGKKSVVDFPMNYNRDGVKIERGKKAHINFAGSESENVNILEYEVFQVVFK